MGMHLYLRGGFSANTGEYNLLNVVCWSEQLGQKTCIFLFFTYADSQVCSIITVFEADVCSVIPPTWKNVSSQD